MTGRNLKDEEIDPKKFTQTELLRHTYNEVIQLRNDLHKYKNEMENRVRSLEDFKLLLEAKMEVQRNWVRNALVMGGLLISVINLVIKYWV